MELAMADPPTRVVPSRPGKGIADGFVGQRLLIVPREKLLRGATLPVVRDLQVTHIGHFHAAKNHFIRRPGGCPETVLIYCLEGTGHARIDGRTWEVGAGKLLVIPAGARHSYFADNVHPWSIIWIHFSGERAADHLAALTDGIEGPVLEIPNRELMREAFEETYRHALDGFSDTGLLGLSTALSRLIGLARIHVASGTMRSRETENRILQTIRRLQAEPAREWQIDELAAMAGMSVPHFFDRFHQQAGCPPKQFLIRLRLQIATALMQESGLTIAQIARQAGYEDPYYFSRLFRRHFGQSPAAHRRDLGAGTRQETVELASGRAPASDSASPTPCSTSPPPSTTPTAPPTSATPMKRCSPT
jgi:AraC-like DNA-binding protein